MDSGRRLRWAEIGKATEEGEYRVGGIVIWVSRDNIEMWRARPDGRFVVVLTEEMEGNRYTLGAFEV